MSRVLTDDYTTTFTCDHEECSIVIECSSFYGGTAGRYSQLMQAVFLGWFVSIGAVEASLCPQHKPEPSEVQA